MLLGCCDNLSWNILFCSNVLPKGSRQRVAEPSEEGSKAARHLPLPKRPSAEDLRCKCTWKIKSFPLILRCSTKASCQRKAHIRRSTRQVPYSWTSLVLKNPPEISHSPLTPPLWSSCFLWPNNWTLCSFCLLVLICFAPSPSSLCSLCSPLLNPAHSFPVSLTILSAVDAANVLQ